MTLSTSRREEKLAKLFSRVPRNAFPTDVNMASDYQPGVFSWDAKMVHFDFLGMGKSQRISVKREDVEVPIDEALFSFAPSPKNASVGERTEFVGTAHSVHKTPLWKKRAWNTLNEWCSARSYGWRPVLPAAMVAADEAYARLTRPEGVYYFVVGPDGAGHRAADRGDLRVFVARFVRHTAMFDDAHWLLAKDLTDEIRTYLDVAWDMHVDGKKAEFR